MTGADLERAFGEVRLETATIVAEFNAVVDAVIAASPCKAVAARRTGLDDQHETSGSAAGPGSTSSENALVIAYTSTRMRS